MRLSDNFTLKEFTRSQTAARMGIENEPTMQEIKKLIMVAENILEPVRREFGKSFSPSSGFRCKELNRAIGSKDTSQHMKAEAVDFEVPGVSNLVLFNWCKNNLDFDQLIREFAEEDNPYAGWVHCSYLGQNNRQEALIYDGKEYIKA